MNGYLKLEADEFTPLRDVVCKTIRRAILTGQMAPGTRLLEVHLAQELGVSRTPVREAIRELEQEGLVIMRPRRGAEVASITAPQVRDVLEVRMITDALATELSCERATDDDIKAIEDAAQGFIDAVKGGSIHTIIEKDTLFHAAIANASHNKKLAEINHDMEDQVNRYRYETLRSPDVAHIAIEEHSKIVAAIKSRDREQAVIATKKHIAWQMEGFLKKFPEGE